MNRFVTFRAVCTWNSGRTRTLEYQQWQGENHNKLGVLTLKTWCTLLTHLMAYQEYSKRKITLDFHGKFTSHLISIRNLSPNTIGGMIKS